MYKWIVTTPLIIMLMMEIMVNSVRKWGESFERAPANLEMYLGAKIPDAPKTLDGINVGLKFQFKCLEGCDVGMNLRKMRHPRLLGLCARFNHPNEWYNYDRQVG